MDHLPLIIKTVVFFVGIACGYVAVTLPFFARRLVCDHSELGLERDATGMSKTRAYFLGVVALGWLAAVVIGLSLERWLTPNNWMLFGMPFAMGLAYAMIAAPLRLWHRLKPWRS